MIDETSLAETMADADAAPVPTLSEAASFIWINPHIAQLFGALKRPADADLDTLLNQASVFLSHLGALGVSIPSAADLVGNYLTSLD